MPPARREGGDARRGSVARAARLSGSATSAALRTPRSRRSRGATEAADIDLRSRRSGCRGGLVYGGTDLGVASGNERSGSGDGGTGSGINTLATRGVGERSKAMVMA